MIRHRIAFACALLLGGCGKAVAPVQPEAPRTEKPAEAAATARPESPPQAEAAPKTPVPPKPVIPPSVASAAPPGPPAAPPKSPTPATPAKPPPAPPAATPTPARAAPQPARTAPAPLDLGSLEARLKATGAIGVLTKLSLKNQVDDLIGRFVAFHDGRRPPTLAELRPAYELLLMKVLSLLQDKDPPLANDINASREAIWSLLTDRQQLARYK